MHRSSPSCIMNKCLQLGIDPKGIHALRKTLNSQMRCGGVPVTVAAALIGNTPAVNEKHYSFDVSTMQQKAEIISNISTVMPRLPSWFNGN